MKFYPILFSTEMIEAILIGRKNQTRRTKLLDTLVFDEESGYVFFNKHKVQLDIHTWKEDILKYCPYGKVGDVLWVRETFCLMQPYHPEAYYFGYKDGFHSDSEASSKYDFSEPDKWKPSIHMPKEACRIFLRITNIRVERVQDITEEDAIKEGVIDYEDGTYKNYFTKKGLRAIDGVECLLAKGSFESLWCSINSIESWESNPWVWVIEFERIEKPVEFTFSNN